MILLRQKFLSFLMKECSGLNYVLLNYINDDITDFPVDEKLEMLIEKGDYRTLLYVISKGKEIIKFKHIKNLSSNGICIKFKDRSSLNLEIKTTIERKGAVLMSTEDVFRYSVRNTQNIKVPAPCHEFEYVLLNALLNKRDVSEKYKAYFSKYSFNVRSKIFAHITPKYHLVINVLDDLYSFQKNNYRKIKAGIKSHRHNKGSRLFFNRLRYIVNSGKIFLMSFMEFFRSEEKDSTSEKNLAGDFGNLLNKKAIAKN